MRGGRSLWRRFLVGSAFVACLTVSFPSSALQSQVEILLDLDDDPATGCSVATVDGAFPGVEQILVTTVETVSVPPSASVLSAATRDCVDPGTDTFSAPAIFDGNWPVGLDNGAGGRDVVETYFPLAVSVVGRPSVVRVGLVVRDPKGQEQALLTVDDTRLGDPILLDLRGVLEIPTLGATGATLLALLLTGGGVVLLRRRATAARSTAARTTAVRAAAVALALLLAAAGVAWAAGSLDGLTDDWLAGQLLASDGSWLFGFGTADRLCFRVDTDLASNSAPVADPQTLMTAEDTLLAITLTGSDADSDPLTFSLVTTPAHGMLTGTPPNLSYQPDLNYDGTDAFDFRVEDPSLAASTASVAITVTPVNDPPLARDDAFSTGEDQPLNGNVLADNGAGADSDVDGDALSVDTTPVSGPTHGMLTLSADGTFTYTPDANYQGNDGFQYTLSDGNLGTDVGTVTISVHTVNDAPSFTEGADQVVNEDAGAQSVPGWATAISPGPADEAGQTVIFLLSNDNNALFSTQPTISASGTLTYTPAANAFGSATVMVTAKDDGGTANGGVDTSAAQSFMITVNAVNDAPSFTEGADQVVDEDAGAQSVAAWATAIAAGPANEAGQTVSFLTSNDDNGLFAVQPAVSTAGTLTYTPAANAAGSATVMVSAMDDGGTANGGVDTSAAQSFTITVGGVNDPPSFAKGADVAVNEDAGAQTLAGWATAISPGPPDEAGQTVSFVTSSDNAALFTVQPAVSTAGTLTFTAAGNAFGVANVMVTAKDDGGTANGGVDTSAAQSFVLTVNAVNDPPSFTKGGDETVSEDSGAHSTAGWAMAISAGPANESGQTVSFVTSNDNNALFSVQPAVSAAGTLSYTVAANASGVANVTATAKDDGGTANGGMDASAAQSFVITVTAVNDPPSFAKGADPTVNEDAGPQTIAGWATAISPGPPDEAGQTVSFQTSNDNNALFSAQPAVSAAGTLTFTPAANAFGVANVTVAAKDDGGTANGGMDTAAAQSFVITVDPVNDPPVAGADVWDFVGNTELVVDLPALATPHVLDTTGTTFGVLDNDADPVENDPITVASIVGCGDATAPFGDGPQCATANGGSVLVQGNGRFRYTPKAGDAAASDSFQYQLSDGIDQVTGTVTLSRSQRVWYVKNNAAAGGLGRSQDPFDTLAEAESASAANDYVFVNLGDGTTGGQDAGIALKSGQHLLGAHVGLSLPVNLNGNGSPTVLVAPSPGNRPLLDDTVVAGPEGVSAVDAIPAEVAGLSLAGNVNAIEWTTTAPFAGNGAFSIHDNVIRSAAGVGVDVNLVGSGATELAFHDNTLTATGTALNVQETGTGALTITAFDDNVVNGNTGGSGMVVSNAVFDSVPGGALNTVSGGTTTIGSPGNGVGGAGLALTNVQGDLHFPGDLQVFSDGGAGVTLLGTGAGLQLRVNTAGAATGVVQAIGGAAVDANLATLDLRLTHLSSSNSAGAGVSLTNVAGTFSAETGSSITNAAGTDFAISGGTANVTYKGTITDDVGALVTVSGASAGTKSFEGAISDGDDGDGSGISLSSNTGATVRFAGGLTLSTSGNTAFSATGGGTVEVCDENPCNPGSVGALVNKITTTTATALNVANTTIGVNNLELRSVSSNGGSATGVMVSNTGALGGLKVRGAGSAGSGGTIANKTGADGSTSTGVGVYLANTAGASLASMQLNDFDNFAIRGSGVNGFTLADTVINALDGSPLNGTAQGEGGVGEGSIRFDNLSGTAAITDSTITHGVYDDVGIFNTNTATPLDLTLTNVTLATTTAANTGNDALRIEIDDTAAGAPQAQATVNVNGGCDFTAARGDLLDVIAQKTVASIGNAAVVDVNVVGNDFSNNHATILSGGGGVILHGQGTLTFDVADNDLQDARGRALNVSKGATAGAFSGTVHNNRIGLTGVSSSGSDESSGIYVDGGGAGSMTVAITDNTVRRTNEAGIFVVANNQTLSGNNATLNATLTGNLVAEPEAALSFAGLWVDVGTGVNGDATTACVDVGGAGALGNDFSTGDPFNAGDVSLAVSTGATLRLPGYGGADDNDAQITSYLTGRNLNAGTTAVSLSHSGTMTTNAGACLQP